MQKKDWLIILLLCAITFTVYANSIGNRFVCDDKALVVNNPLIRTPKMLPNIFKTSLYDHWVGMAPYDRMYRPLQEFSYFLDYQVFGINAPASRLVNISLHALNGIILYIIMLLLFGSSLIGFASAALFLAHPLQAGSVKYISGRADILSTLFILLSILFFIQFALKQKGRVYLFLSLGCALLAPFCRESALILFLLIALILFLFKTGKNKYLPVFFFLGTAFLYLALRLLALGGSAFFRHEPAFGLLTRLGNFVNLAFRYTGLIVAPFELRVLRTTPFVGGFLSAPSLIPLLSLILIILIFIKFRLKNKIVLFGIFWFFICLLPVFFTLDGFAFLGKAMVSENWVYLASIGIFCAAGYLISLLKKGAVWIAVILICLYSLLTVYNNRFWKNNYALFSRVMQYSAGNSLYRKDLIDACLEEGRFDEALKNIKILDSYYPDSILGDISLGNYYFYKSDPQKALEYYNKVTFKSFFSQYRVSSCYMQLEAIDRAIVFGLASFKSNPYFTPNLIQLGDLYREKGQMKESMEYYQIASEFDPKNPDVKERIKNAK